MGNVGGKDCCYGCGVCAMACGKHLISLKLSPDGFYVPYIDNIQACSNCGLCESVCAYNYDSLLDTNKPQLSVGAWSKDSVVRKKSSSGGVCYEFERNLLSKGYKICVVRYNAELARAEHYVSDNLEDLVSGLGSKYIQSYTLDAFLSLSKGENYLVVGSPCQMDSLRRFIRKFNREDDFVLIDFFCHGVPSSILWEKYSKKVEAEVGKLSYVSWRNKFTGWHDSWAMSIDGVSKRENRSGAIDENVKGTYYSRYSQGDIFYKMFLGDSCFNKACYENCKYKYDHSSADIRVGDFWGDTYKDNEDGVSSVVAFTHKGVDLVLSSNIEISEHPFSVVAEGQMKSPLKFSSKDSKIFTKLKEDVSLEEIVAYQERLNKIENWKHRFTHPHETALKVVTKIIGRYKK